MFQQKPFRGLVDRKEAMTFYKKNTSNNYSQRPILRNRCQKASTSSKHQNRLKCLHNGCEKYWTT